MSYQVLEVARYIVNYSNKYQYELSHLKLQKLLYLIQAYFLIKKNKPCFNEKIYVSEFGVVIPEVYQEFGKFGSCNIPVIKSFIVFDKKKVWTKKINFTDAALSHKDKKIIDKIIDKFSDYTATDLFELTQKQIPVLNAYNSETKEISNEAIKKFFKK